MSRRKKHAAHANHERWLVSYADFITLLFAFFVVMYSTSQVDQRKVGKLAMAIQVAFQELGVFPASTSAVPMNSADPMPFNSVQAVESAERTAALGRIVPPPEGALGTGDGRNGMTTLQKELEQALAPEIKRKEVALHAQRDGLVVSLREVGFFDSGSAQIRSDSLAAFSRMAGLLASREYLIRIEGHTDTVPIHNAQFASNWELSTGRATELVRLLITKYNFAPQRLSAAGFAEFHPVASNATADGRAQNRRVDVVVLGKDRVTANNDGD
jgi:chemotaxis protein MotB